MKYPVPDLALRSRECWCGCSLAWTLYSTDRWGQNLQSVVCRACGTLRLDPRMDRIQAADYYANAYPERQLDAQSVFLDQIKMRSSAYLREWIKPNLSILDYGCGPGGKLADLARRGFRISGFDINPDYLCFAESQGIPPVQRGQRFDVIYLSHTLEHWTDPLGDLEDVINLYLRLGGTLIIEVPLIDRLLLGSRRDGIHGDIYFVHAWYFTVRSLDKLMGALGCQRIDTDRLTRCVYTYNCPRRAVASTPAGDAVLRAMIRLCSLPVISTLAPLLNRVTGYIDVSAAITINPKEAR